MDRQTEATCTTDFRIRCPNEIPFHPHHSLYLPTIPFRPLYVPCATCLLQSSPVHVPCPPQPLSVIPCTPTVTLSLLLSPLVHVSICHLFLPPDPLHSRWLLGEMLCSLYIVILAVTNHEIKSSINILVHINETNFEMYSTYYNVCISLQFMHLKNTYF